MSDRIAILGASRGLGLSLAKHIVKVDLKASLFLSSRKIKQIGVTQQFRIDKTGSDIYLYEADFSKLDQISHLYDELIRFNPTYIVYCAGGGPYGFFEDQKWSSHEWALNVNFLAPAKLLHFLLADKNQTTFSKLKSLTCIGSSVAEDKPDPRAASYCAAKHALKGLVATIQSEQLCKQQKDAYSQSEFKTIPLNARIKDSSAVPVESFHRTFQVKLFSPGYMKTSMLPENSEPVQKGLALDPDSVAAQLFSFIKSEDLMYN